MSWFSVEHLKEKKKIAALARVARRSRGEKQRKAAQALADIGDGEAARALLTLAASDDIAVWEPAQAAICTIRNEAAVPALCDALLSSGYNGVKCVLAALTNMESDLALNGLLKALEDPKLAPDVLAALRGRNRAEMVPPLEDLLEELTAREATGAKSRLWQQSLCRQILELLTEVDDIGAIKALHHFLRNREGAPVRLRVQAAHALAAKGLPGEEALAGYVGEKFTDVDRVMLLMECMPNEELLDILFAVMPPNSADEFGQALMASLNRMEPGHWKYIVALIERLDRDNARSALLMWFVQTKAASPDAAYALARHGNTRPVLVKRLVDMVRFEDQDIRLRAGDLLYRLYADKLITEEGVHLVEAKTDEEGKVTDYEYIGYKDYRDRGGTHYAGKAHPGQGFFHRQGRRKALRLLHRAPGPRGLHRHL